MKRFFFLCFATIFLSFALFSIDVNSSINFSTELSLLNGNISEFVFDAKNSNTDHIESQLDWDIKNIPVIIIDENIDFLRYFNIEMKTLIGIPKRSGNMQDYDWLNSIYTSWKDDAPTELTNYSIHDNFLGKYISFFISAGGNIYLPAEIKLTPFITYQYEYISFASKDGYKTYKAENWVKKSFSGKVISYKQEMMALLLGLKLNINTIPHTYINLDFSLSPKMTFLNALDYHYLNQGSGGTLFWDKMANLWQINSNAVIQYKINNNHALGISGRIQYIPLGYGPTYSKYLDSDGNIISEKWYAQSSKGGTKRFIWSLGLNYSFSL